MVLVKRMSVKGHEESEMTKEALLELVCKLGKGKYYMVNSHMEVIRDVSAIGENESITIVPVVAGGAN